VEALEALAAAWRAHDWTTVRFADASCTAAAHRTHHAFRRAVVADGFDDLANQLAAPSERPASCDPAAGMVFVFTEDERPWLGLARSLVSSNAVARQAFEECDAALAPTWDGSVRSAIEATGTNPGDIEIAEPLTFIVHVMLARVWQSWGVRPSVCLGLGTGEVAAAYIAGALSLEAAAGLIGTRARRQPEARACALYSATSGGTVPLIHGHTAAVFEAAMRKGHRVFVGAGPHTRDLDAIGEAGRALGIDVMVVASARHRDNATRTMLQAAGRLYEAGFDLDWSGIYPGRRPVVSLPAYPWLGERFWTDHRRPADQSAFRDRAPHDTTDGGRADLAEEITNASPSVRQALLEARVRAAVARVVRSTPDRVSPDTPFRALGLDSLMALELSQALEAATGVPLSHAIFWNYPTVRGVVEYLVDCLARPGAPAPVDVAGSSADADLEAVLQEIDALSDEQAHRLAVDLDDGEEVNRV
jgi:acyl transferase domain-containing protein